MRIFKFLMKIFFKKEKYKNLSYMEASLGLIEDDDLDDI